MKTAVNGFDQYMTDKAARLIKDPLLATPMTKMLLHAAECLTDYFLNTVPEFKKEFKKNPDLIVRRLLEVLIIFSCGLYRKEYESLYRHEQCIALMKLVNKISEDDVLAIVPQKVLNDKDTRTLLRNADLPALFPALAHAICINPSEFDEKADWYTILLTEQKLKQFKASLLDIFDAGVTKAIDLESKFTNQYPF